MRRPLFSSWRSKRFRPRADLWLLLLGLALSTAAWATGFYGVESYLDGGGEQVDAAPEFYWDLEVKRLSRNYLPKEKASLKPGSFSDIIKAQFEDASLAAAMKRPTARTAEADAQDFAEALQQGRLHPTKAEEAAAQHEAARAAVVQTEENQAGLPPEFPSEFADYHRGAYAFHLGEKHWDEAKAAWEALLQRPAEERHYRTVWAAFMLGKLAMKRGEAEAARWFQKTRELAAEGFADSLCMAADSYGWEGRSAWKLGHPEQAAVLFLTQLALGDESAVISLKALIPDRESVGGMLNYGYGPDDAPPPTPAEQAARDARELAGLRAAARDPLLRRLETAHILATETERSDGPPAAAGKDRAARWLRLLGEAKVHIAEDAEYLGWLEYHRGRYAAAAHWLEVARPGPAADWLRAKLLRRSGKMEEAARSMAKAWQAIRNMSAYTGWHPAPEVSPEDYVDEQIQSNTEGGWSFRQALHGDLGSLHLTRGDFVQAFDVFLQGNLWSDAAFVAEDVLTADELKNYLAHAGPPTAPKAADSGEQEEDPIARARYLLGRKLVREKRYEEAARYLNPPYDQILSLVVQALREAADEKLPKLQRARAWFTAAWYMRYDGMELMGTEVSPDDFVTEGDFEEEDLALERRTGRVPDRDPDGAHHTSQPVVLKASPQEIVRLKRSDTQPHVRYHYRVIASEYAMKGAELLPDNSPELADVINTAGRWVQNRLPKLGDRYYQVFEKRCGKTELAKTVLKNGAFKDTTSVWSESIGEERAALRKKLGLEVSDP